jgi:hypothetical protein
MQRNVICYRVDEIYIEMIIKSYVWHPALGRKLSAQLQPVT